MPRPNPIQYAERLYAAIRAANFSPISFLAFGNAVKDGVELRRMPRIAAEPFMRVVGEILEWDEEANCGLSDPSTGGLVKTFEPENGNNRAEESTAQGSSAETASRDCVSVDSPSDGDQRTR